MLERIFLGIVCSIAVAASTLDTSFSQSTSRQQQPPAIEEWARDFTVLTMAADGAWGTATDPRVNRAIYLAISNCKAMSKLKLGCGAYQTTVRGGWSLGIRCGSENIIKADRVLAEAERQARKREADLREFYAPNMPPCVRVVTIDPNGDIVAPPVPQVEYSGQTPAVR